MIGVIKKIKKKIFNNNNDIILKVENLQISNNSVYFNASNDEKIKGYIVDNSKLQIGENCNIECTIYCQNNTEIIIGNDVVIKNLIINCKSNSKIYIEDGVIIDSETLNTLYTDNGTIHLCSKSHIKSKISAKFGGKVKIGNYTDIGEGTEIRAEEEVVIGSYCLFSYNISIFDTNTHSIDWKVRRQNIISAYPNCFDEIEKPSTKPIRIGDDVWLGKNVVINKGVNIGDRVIVGINTVVTSAVYENDSLIVSDKPRIILKNNLNEK